MLLALLLLLQDTPLLTENFDREPPRDSIYPEWERVTDARHPPYNTIRCEEGSIAMRTLGGAAAVRHAGCPADPRCSYALTVTVHGVETRENRAWVSLLWLDKRRNDLRVDEAEGAQLLVETPPADAAWVRVALHFGGPDVRARARFDSVRLVARPRINVRFGDRALPVYRHQERVTLHASVPALDDAEVRLRLLDADGRSLHPVSDSIDPLPPAAYRIEAQARRGDAVCASRELWLVVWGTSIFDPAEPTFGVLLPDTTADPIAICDAAGARDVAIAMPQAEALLPALLRRPDTIITAFGKEDPRFLHEIDRWKEQVDIARPSSPEEALHRGLALADRRVFFAGDLPTLYAVRTLNDLIGGAHPASAPAWAPGARAFQKRGRLIVAAADTELRPPLGWSLVDPLLGTRPPEDVVKVGSRTVFLVSP